MSLSSASLPTRLPLAALSILVACRANPVNAADSDALAQPVALPTVVVTPTRLPTPETEVGSSVTVITEQEIQRKQERTLPDALKDVPGLNVVQTGQTQLVSVTPDDYSNPVQGRILAWTTDEIIIRHDDPTVGKVNLHFPRIGFDATAVGKAAA